MCDLGAGMARGNGSLGFQRSFEGCEDIRLSVQAQMARIGMILTPLPIASGLLVRDSKHLTVNSSSMEESIYWVTEDPHLA